jgi:hypothetical protein
VLRQRAFPCASLSSPQKKLFVSTDPLWQFRPFRIKD